MLQFKETYSDERLRTNLVITEEIEKFLNENFQFQKMPKGFLVAKMKKPFVQVTVHFPEYFEVGKETSLLYWQHCNPFNTVEHRFSFCPPQDEKLENCTLESFISHVKDQLNICSNWAMKIDQSFYV